MIDMVKLAIGEIDACHPLDGEIYGSEGLKITLLGITVAGGKLNTEYFVLSVSAEAIPARSVDMAAISPPSISDQDKALVSHEREQVKCCPCGKGLAGSHRS